MRLLSTALVAMCCVGCASGGAVTSGPTPADIPMLEARVAGTSGTPSDALLLAQAYRAAGRHADARTVLQASLERNANQPDASILLGATYEDLGQYAEARAVYRDYLAANRSGKLRKELEQRLTLLQRKELEAKVRETIAREAELANTPPEPFTVAVFPFEFVGDNPEYAPLGRALAELLVNDLSQTQRLKVLERAQVQLLLDEMNLAQTGAVDPATAARTGRMLGAERVVQGSIDGSDAELQLETSIVRVTNNAWPGEAEAATLTEEDRLAALMDMQNRLALRIYSTLGIELTAAERAAVNQRPTENVMAILAFGRGLQSEDAGNFAAAASHFAEAARLDPSFTAARQSEARVNEEAAAAETTTTELASSVDAPAAAPVEAPTFFLPNPARRDAVAEVLGTEGGAGSGTILELIIRRPQ